MNNPQQLKERIYALNPELKTYYHSSTGNNLRCWKCGEPDNYDTRGKCKVAEYGKLHLEHVLMLFQNDIFHQEGKVSFGFGKIHIDFKHEDKSTGHLVYDLSKTFDQNIAENEELVTFLLNIIK